VGKPNEPTVRIMVESYQPDNTAGKHGPVHIRPVEGQGYATTMDVRCSKVLSRDYPVGTRFWIRAKLTDREGGGEFLSSYHGWPHEVV
jgi:hypothetical protein